MKNSNDSPFKRLVLNSASDQVLAFDILNIVKSRDGQFWEQTTVLRTNEICSGKGVVERV